MSVSAFNKPQQTALQVVTDKKTTNVVDHLHAIACKVEHEPAPIIGQTEPMLQVVATQTTPDNFTITFSYQQQLHRTRVLRVGSGYRKPAYVYKVVLNSRLSNGEAQLCWLQQDNKHWNVLLGSNLDNTLINAITTAIESME